MVSENQFSDSSSKLKYAGGSRSRSCSRAEAASSHAAAIDPAASDDEFFLGRSEAVDPAWVCKGVPPQFAAVLCMLALCALYVAGLQVIR